MRKVVFLAAATLGACNRSPSATAPVPTVTAAEAISPAQRAKTLLQHQIDLARQPDDPTGGKAILATFAPDAVIADHVFSSLHGAESANGALNLRTGPEGVQINSVTIASLDAGGTGDVVWFVGELAIESTGPNNARGSGKMPITEVLSATAGWRAVVAIIGGRPLQPSGDNLDVPGANSTDGPLLRVLGVPGSDLATTALTRGPRNTPLVVTDLQPLHLAGRGRELDTPSWRLALGSFDHPNAKHANLTDRLFGLAVALPNPDHSWRVALEIYDGN